MKLHSNIGRAPAGCIALLFAVAILSGAAGADDPPDAELARLMRIASQGKPAERALLARGIKVMPRPATLLPVAIAGLFSSEKDLAAAVTRRDAQGNSLFAYYQAHYDGDERFTTSQRTRYDVMKAESRALNAAIAEARRLLDEYVVTTRALAERAAASELDRSGAASVIREALGRNAPIAARSALLGAIPESLFPDVAEDVFRIAVEPGHRDWRVAAIRSGMPALGDRAIAPLGRAVADPDPFVRRASAQVLASMASASAIDLLVARLGQESGLPAEEIVRSLRELSGENFGAAPATWERWWAETRAAWVGPFASDRRRAESSEEVRWKYFGLSLVSKRLVFVIDTSASMERGLGYTPPLRGTVASGPVKMTVARGELAKAIDGLPADAFFSVIAYETTMRAFSPRLVPANDSNRKGAKTWVERLKPSGNTNPSSPLIEAFAMTRPVRGSEVDKACADTIVLLSDGAPTCGPIKYEEDILAEVDRLNADRLVTIHTVHLGHEDVSGFMQKLAERNGGQFVHHK